MKSSDQDVDDDAPTLEYRLPARPIAVRTASLPDVLNSREAATALRMGVKELRQLIERGELPAARLGPRRVIRIAKTAIVSLLRGDRAEPPAVVSPDATVDPCKPARRRWKGRPS
jgi:excisionase family DNA binding protein